MLRHVVLLEWTDHATEQQVAEVVDGLRALPQSVPEIRRYELGGDLGLRDGNFDLAIIAEFDDEVSFRTYVAHPEHVAVIDQLITPILARRASVQFHPD